MGLFANRMHKSARKAIATEIGHFKAATPDQRAGALYYLWLTRGMNTVLDDRSQFVNLPIYYYVRGGESPIIRVMEALRDRVPMGFTTALQLHFHTNLVVSYPTEGYSPLVRELWRTLLTDYTDLAEPVNELRSAQEDEGIRRMVSNNDVSEEDLVAEPSKITPHFLVPGHPLSAKLVEEEKMGRFLVDNG